MADTVRLSVGATTRDLALVRQQGVLLWKSYEPPRDLSDPTKPLFVQSDWSGGFGQADLTDATRYHYGEGVDTSLKGQFFLGPARTLTGVHGGAAWQGYPIAFGTLGDSLYCATNTGYFYKWSDASGHWDQTASGVGTILHPMVGFGDYLYLARGAGIAYLYTADGVTFQTADQTDNSANGFLVAPEPNGVHVHLWKWKTPNALSSNEKPWRMASGGGQWVDPPAYIGGTDDPITRLFVHNGLLFVGKQGGLYHYDTNGSQWALLPELRLSKSMYNFVHQATLKGSTYVGLYNRMAEITTYNTFANVGPLQTAEGAVSTANVQGLAADRDFLYCCMYEQPAGQYYLYKGSEVRDATGYGYWSWSPIRANTGSMYLSTMQRVGSYPLRLWYNDINAGQPAYIILSDNPIYDSNYNFGSTGYLETGWIDFGVRDWVKVIDSVLVECQGSMSGTKTVNIKYQPDESGGWVDIGTYVTTNLTLKKYLSTPAAVRKVKFKITLTSDNEDDTPIVKHFQVYGTIRPPRLNYFDFTVYAEQGHGISSKELRDFLVSGRDANYLLTLWDRFGDSHKVRMMVGYPQEVEILDEYGKQIALGMKVLMEKVDWQ